MVTKFSTNLNLPVVPEVTDPELFSECLKIYAAIQALADSIDVYTNEGKLAIDVDITLAQATSALAKLRAELAEFREELLFLTFVTNWEQPGAIGGTTPNTVAATDLTATTITTTGDVTLGTKLSVNTTLNVGTTCTVGGAFAANGKAASGAIALPANATDLASIIALGNALKSMAITFGFGS